MQETTNTESKVLRRGIGTARGTAKFKFNHTDANKNGLFLGHLEDVKVTMIKIGEDTTGMPSFNGLEIPKIIFTFTSNEDNVNLRKYINLQFMAVESNVNTIPDGKEVWKIDRVFDYLKHILDVYYFKGRELTEDDNKVLSLPFIDYDANGEYVPVEPEKVIAGWKILFENVENILNRGNNGQSYYKPNGKFIPIWIKLIRYTKDLTKKTWREVSRGELSFPNYVTTGVIEIVRPNITPAIRLNPINECIIPMQIEKPKTPNMGMLSAISGTPMGSSGIMVDTNSISQGSEAIDFNTIEDIPF